MAEDTSNANSPNESGTGAAPESGAGTMAEAALKAAQDAVTGLAGGLGMGGGGGGGDKTPVGATPMSLPALTASLSPSQQKAIELLSDVNLDVKIELGRTRMLVEDVLKLGEGAVVELDKLAGDPVDIFVNNRHVARGEVLVLNDSFCVRVSEILQQVGEPATAVAAPS
jgi:flagellar motor switch protein FliN/FliY